MVWYGISLKVLNNLPSLSITLTLISSFCEVITCSLKSLTVGLGKIFTSMDSAVVGVVVDLTPPFVSAVLLVLPLFVPAKPGGGQAGSLTVVERTVLRLQLLTPCAVTTPFTATSG